MAAVDRDPHDDPADVEALGRYARALADAVVAALPGWVERAVTQRYEGWVGDAAPATVLADAQAAGRRAVAEVEPRLRALLALDVDEQRNNPLALLREAVAYPSDVLRGAGVPAVIRDAQAQRLFPDDDYDLTPARFADLDPSVHEPGLVWGAAKAHVVLARRRAGG